MTLIRPDLDIWEPGEHNGTFRGNNPAFVTATAALDFWEDDELTRDVLRKGAMVSAFLAEIASDMGDLETEVRGRGLLQGLDCKQPGVAEEICRRAFAQGLIMETSGPESTVVKLMPPLTIDEAELQRGLDIVARCAADVMADRDLADLAEAPVLAASAAVPAGGDAGGIDG